MVKIIKFLFAPALFCLLVGLPLEAQQLMVSGYVKDMATGENLVGAYITVKETGNATMTDNNGYFSIILKDRSVLQFSFIGYKTKIINVERDTLFSVQLEHGEEQLGEVVVSANRLTNPNLTALSYDQMTHMPALGGKPDVIKSLQLMPGFNPPVEGSGLMLVRGGDPGQNLYLFDDIPVIYVNHLGGFMSVFNPDIINNIEVYKGGFPSRYGGKLSSVVDIAQKEGNSSALRGSLGIGITDASFSIEGPLKGKKLVFIATGRKTLIDPLMALTSALSDMSTYIISYGFHDVNAKATWRPNDRNTLSLNLYQGDDYLNYWSTAKNSADRHRLGNAWGNWLASIRYNSIVTPRLHATNSFSFSRYRLKEFMKYSLKSSEDTSEYMRRYRSVVRDISYRSEWKFDASAGWKLEFGLQTSLLRFVPNDIYVSDRNIQARASASNSLETAVFADNKISIGKSSYLLPGIRLVNYLSGRYSGFSPEPRFNMHIALSGNSSISAGYMRTAQFSHLLFTTGNIMNNEVWIPSGAGIPFARSDQYTLGFNTATKDNMYSIEANMYYKTLDHLATFREGYTSLQGDNDWITKVETGGTGKSAGLELMLKKNSGKWTGFAGYTFSRTTRQFPGINYGREYIYEYNRPHSFTLNLSHKLNERLDFNLTWVYQSGLPYTPALGRHYLLSADKNFHGEYFYYDALIYGERNSGRLRDYHRLDLGLNYSVHTRRGRNAVWNFSVYNAYNRHNPVYYYYNTSNTGEMPKVEHGYSEPRPLSLYQLSLFPIIPSISYKVFFDDGRDKDYYLKRIESKKNDVRPASYIKKRVNIKAGYSRYSPYGNAGRMPGLSSDEVSQYVLEAGYGMTNFIEIGPYAGYASYRLTMPFSGGSFMKVRKQAFSSGISCNLHLLPMVVKRESFMFDLYLTGKFGTTMTHRAQASFVAGSGFATYFGKHAGLFGEYLIEKQHRIDFSKLRYGLAWKF